MTVIDKALELITSRIPDIEDDLFKYIEGILTEGEQDFEEANDVFEAVGCLLKEISKGINEDQIRILCEEVYNVLSPNHVFCKQLDEPVHLRSIVKLKGRDHVSQPLQLDESSKVDTKKLQKAEMKLRHKADKRSQHTPKESERPILDAQPSVSQDIKKQAILLDEKQGTNITTVRLENFDVAFGNRSLINNATMVLTYGRRYGLVGRNGTGKTTLLRVLSRGCLHLPTHLRILHVEQEVVGDDTTAINSVLQSDSAREKLLQEESRLTNLINSGSQDPDVSSSLAEVYSQLQMISSDEAPARASAILAGLGFTTEMQRQPTKMFSGGWRMRIALAKALFSKPDLLLLDEPTNMLDIRAIIWLQRYLQYWHSMVLVASHDQRFLEEVTTDILLLTNQSLEHFKGNYAQFKKTRAERVQHQQREYNAQQHLRSHVQEFIDRFRYNAKRASLVQSKIKMLEKLPVIAPVEKDVEMHFAFPPVACVSPPILYLDEVEFGYLSHKPVLKQVNLSTTLRSRICIVGENGAGKSTLLHLLMGRLTPLSGMRFAHHNLRIGYFAQHHVDQLNLSVTSLESLQKQFPGRTLEEYLQQLGHFGLTGGLQNSQVSSLSGGQKSRLAFSMLAMMHPNFLILDEPTNHLDIETMDALAEALRKFQGGVILVSHDENFIRSTCDEVWMCDGGTVKKLDGGFEEYRKYIEKDFDI